MEDAAAGRLLAAFQAHFTRYVAITAAFKRLADRGRLGAAGAAVGDGAETRSGTA